DHPAARIRAVAGFATSVGLNLSTSVDRYRPPDLASGWVVRKQIDARRLGPDRRTVVCTSTGGSKSPCPLLLLAQDLLGPLDQRHKIWRCYKPRILTLEVSIAN